MSNNKFLTRALQCELAAQKLAEIDAAFTKMAEDDRSTGDRTRVG
ncbi:hypothetical protein [Scytonema sp. UIC 10036]|nr:hypothetical protein [Scytonema sp. UIC 10036]